MEPPPDDTDPLEPSRTALEALAHSATPSKAARIRALLPQIEAAQTAGASNAQIVEKLNRTGLTITLRTFETTLSRVRRERLTPPAENEPANRQTATAEDSRKKDGASAPPQRRKRSGLDMPESPPKFQWDPLEQPTVTFIDDDQKKED